MKEEATLCVEPAETQLPRFQVIKYFASTISKSTFMVAHVGPTKESVQHFTEGCEIPQDFTRLPSEERVKVKIIDYSLKCRNKGN